MSWKKEVYPHPELPQLDWNNESHQRIITANLVEQVYRLEYHRLENRHEELHASQRWGSLHFDLKRKLLDKDSIFGCIYECKSSYSVGNAPKIVIAFKGMLFTLKDIKLVLKTILYKFHDTSRFQCAIDAVNSAIAEVGAANVWLAGHSLGAALALLVGKSMARRGYLIKTFLFNPPFLSLSLERITNTVLKDTVHGTRSFVIAGLSRIVKGHEDRLKKFTELSNYEPLLFVNPKDDICSGYIGYFEYRMKMAKIGAGRIENIATQNSIKSLLKNALGKQSEAYHKIPSAKLFVNKFSTSEASSSLGHLFSDFIEAHGIKQWCSDSNVLGEFRKYSFDA